MEILPFSQGSIVDFTVEGRKRWRNAPGQYLVEKVTLNGRVAYSLFGHRKLGSNGQGFAWVDHDLLVLVSRPTIKSWAMLGQAVSRRR